MPSLFARGSELALFVQVESEQDKSLYRGMSQAADRQLAIAGESASMTEPTDASFFKQMVEGSRLLHLTELHLPATELDAAAVSELIHFGARLRTLCLDMDTLSALIMTVLSQADWSTLEVLSIWRCCRMGAETIRALARADCCSLTTWIKLEKGSCKLCSVVICHCGESWLLLLVLMLD